MRVIDCVQGTPEWLNARLGVITGTRLEQAFKHSDALKNQLLSERMATYVINESHSRSMERGSALEPLAKKAYEKQYSVTVKDVGFILHPERNDIGLSPDGIIGDGTSAVEFKCPKSPAHIEYMRNTQPPRKYIFQLAAYFFNIPTLQSIDFASYDELNEIKPLHKVTYTLDDILKTEYLKNKTIGSMDHLESKVFGFADSVNEEYQKLVF